MRAQESRVRATALTVALGTALVLGLACDSGKPAETGPTKAAPANADKPAIAKPHINPHESMNAKAVNEPVVMSQEGTFDVVVGSETLHLSVLPTGQNTARATDGRKPLLSVAGTARTGYPRIVVEMTGWRPDRLTYPIELQPTKMRNFRFVYRAGERGALSTQLEATLRGDNKVTLDSYEDGVLSGRFSGTVAPRGDAEGTPLPVKGSFKTKLRLHKVAPNPTDAAPAKAPEQPAPNP